jgi:DNA-binding MarR family transcriptional regulator
MQGDSFAGSRIMTAKKSHPLPARALRSADYRLLAEFRHHLRTFMVFSEEAARAAGLASQQHQALLAIKGFPDDAAPTIGELAECLAIRHHSAVGLVDRLVQARLIVRTFDSDDRRRVGLVLTRRGENMLAELSVAHRDELRRMAPMLRAVLARLEE